MYEKKICFCLGGNEGNIGRIKPIMIFGILLDLLPKHFIRKLLNVVIKFLHQAMSIILATYLLGTNISAADILQRKL